MPDQPAAGTAKTQRAGAGRNADSAPPASPRPGKRADARRNEQTLLDAAAAVFVRSGVEAPVRDIAAKAGVGMGTIYRHFPTRADLVVAVYRHQVEACAAAAPALLRDAASPDEALGQWIDLFTDFLVTKHGLAGVMQSEGFEALHTYFLDHLVPACQSLLDAAGIDVEAVQLMRGIGNLCIGDQDRGYEARPLIRFLVNGLSAG